MLVSYQVLFKQNNALNRLISIADLFDNEILPYFVKIIRNEYEH